MVQVETLGELGVFFTLFVVGLEFSPERLRKVNEGFELTKISIFISSMGLYATSEQPTLISWGFFWACKLRQVAHYFSSPF